VGAGRRALEDLVMASWAGRNVFVSGASGLLGSALVEELCERGAAVTCLVRDWVPAARLFSEGLSERTNLVRGSLEDGESALRALNEYEIDTVFHLGAQTIVGTASRSPLSTFDSNIKGTWVLLEACRQVPKLVKRVLVASSDKAYGAHEKLPYTEEAPLVGRYPYDVSKSCTDLIAQSYFHSFGLPVVVTRCGNLYGPGDLNWNRLVPGTIRSALQGERPIVRSDGTLVRDYFYVRDAVEAYLLLAEHLEPKKLQGQAFNFGTEEPKSVLELVELILQAVGRRDLEPDVKNEATNEIPRQYLDCSKAQKLLGWRPARTLVQGLAETVAWYRHSLGG
jgi:CDP-glucose 4,6-dehydratase